MQAPKEGGVMGARMFKVKNFERFQHYKDRSPPWIKLYNELLDDYDFGCLQDASKMHLIAIWLLASRSDNLLPYDSGWIARRINATEPVNLEALANAGFIVVLQGGKQDASAPLAERLTRERDTNHPEKRQIDKPVPSFRDRVFKALGEPIGFFSDGELNSIALEFPDTDHETKLKGFWPWGVRQSWEPDRIKATYVKTLKNERGARELNGSRDNKPEVVVSSALANSPLTKKREMPEFPEVLDRRREMGATG